MKTTRVFLTKANEIDEIKRYYSINEETIEDELLIHDTYDSYGQKISSCDAEDYSVMNNQCDLYNECINEIKERFLNNLDADDIDINDDLSFSWSGWDLEGNNINLSDELKNDIEDFIKDFEEKNNNYSSCKGFNFWNGSNWQTVVLEREYDDFKNYEIVDDSELIEELNQAIEESEFYQNGSGYREYRSKKYSIIDSQWADRFEEFEITEL